MDVIEKQDQGRSRAASRRKAFSSPSAVPGWRLLVPLQRPGVSTGRTRTRRQVSSDGRTMLRRHHEAGRPALPGTAGTLPFPPGARTAHGDAVKASGGGQFIQRLLDEGRFPQSRLTGYTQKHPASGRRSLERFAEGIPFACPPHGGSLTAPRSSAPATQVGQYLRCLPRR